MLHIDDLSYLLNDIMLILTRLANIRRPLADSIRVLSLIINRRDLIDNRSKSSLLSKEELHILQVLFNSLTYTNVSVSVSNLTELFIVTLLYM